MNVDLIIASSIFIVFISAVLLYIFGFQKQGASWQSLIELRKEASDLASEIISLGNPENWNKENVIPSKIGLASSAYLIPILISDTSGYNRINEPIAQEIVFDEDCKNIAWNGTVRIFDENFNEIPFRFVNQTFCPFGYLQKAILFFEVNVSANSTRKLQIFFYNSTQVNPKDYGNFSSLVMWLTFEEGNGNIVYDYSGNNNNGTLYNGSNVCSNPPTSGCPTWVDGKFGKALQFDGIDDYVLVSDSSTLQIVNQLTITAWVNETGRKPLAKIASRRSGSYFYFLGIDNGKPYGGVGDGSNYNVTLKSFTVPLNEWHYLAFVYDDNNNKMHLYYDGMLKETVSTTISLPAKIGVKLSIGADFEGTQNFFSGTIDDVRIYNRALTDEEILSHYQQPLTIKIFPRTEVSLISFEKLEALRNVSYDLLKDALQKGYNFRVEIYEK